LQDFRYKKLTDSSGEKTMKTLQPWTRKPTVSLITATLRW
jgi:hypothetical protein